MKQIHAFLLIAATGILHAQTPAPVHDLTGVWMLRNPQAMRAYTGATFTREDPEMMPWALEKFKTAKSSNNGGTCCWRRSPRSGFVCVHDRTARSTSIATSAT